MEVNLTPFPKASCDILTVDDYKHYHREGTKVVLLLGDRAHRLFHEHRGVNLFQQRGAPYQDDSGVVYLSSFFPQDVFDVQDFEGRFNTLSDGYGEENQTEKDSETKSTKGKTLRPNWRFWLKNDIRKAVRITRTGLQQVNGKIHTYPNSDEIIDLLTKVKNRNLYLDIETDENLNITCIGFGYSSSECWVIPLYQTHIQSLEPIYGYDNLTVCKILRALAIAFRDNTIVVHNAPFDLLVLCWRYRISLPPIHKVICTMLAHQRCYPEVEKSLGHVLSLYTDQAYHKNEGVFSPKNADQANNLYRYNGKDVLSLPLVLDGIKKEAIKLGAELSIKESCKMLVPYLEASIQGMRVDIPRRTAMIDEANRRRIQMARLASIMIGGGFYHEELTKSGKKKIVSGFNPGSVQQVAAYLYKGMQYEEPKEDKTNVKTLLSLYLKCGNPAIPAIIQYRALGKKRGDLDFSLYPGHEFFIYSKESLDRVTCAYKIAGPKSLRRASAALLDRWGRNVQNFNIGDRRCIIADEGKELVQVDQSGADALILAYLMKHGNFRDLFIYKVKPHTFVCFHVFQKQLEDHLGFSIKDHVQSPIKDLREVGRWKEVEELIKETDKWSGSKRYYYISKKAGHSFNYGMKHRKFINTILEETEGLLLLEDAEGKRISQMYHSIFPEIQQYHVDTISEVRKTRILRTMFGSPRTFTKPESDELWREAYAFRPSATVAEITGQAFVELKEKERNDLLFTEWGVDILQDNHDSILAQCNKGFGTKLAGVMQTCINKTMTNAKGESFTMRSSGYVGDNWGEMKEIS